MNSRGMFVTTTLAIILGGLFLLFVNSASFGSFSYILACVFGFALLGYLHYAAWGYSLSKESASERAEFLRQQQRELDAQTPLDPYGIQIRRSTPSAPDERIQR